MKMRLSVFSLLFVLLILFLLYKLFLTPGGRAGLPPESPLKTIDKAKALSADSSFDIIVRGINSFKQEKGELPATLEKVHRQAVIARERVQLRMTTEHLER